MTDFNRVVENVILRLIFSVTILIGFFALIMVSLDAVGLITVFAPTECVAVTR